jgi:DNA repair protein RecN (Recombination protein N)
LPIGQPEKPVQFKKNDNFEGQILFNMLKHLLIKNYALIQHLEIDPSEKLNIITGETGAGKSIMLGAIGLLLGNRADTKVLYNESQKCVIEGEFSLVGYDLQQVFESCELEYEPRAILRREIAPSGKSRAFINDTPVNLEQMRMVANCLMDIHSQHDTLLLAGSDFQLGIVDAYAGVAEELAAYQTCYRQYQSAQRAYQKLVHEYESAKAAFEYNQFLFQELEKAQLDQLDQAALEEELRLLEHAETIKSNLIQTIATLDQSEFAVTTQLKTALMAMGQIAKFARRYEDLRERLKSVQIEVQDILLEAEREESDLVVDVPRMQFVKERLDMLYTLQNKHQAASVAELITLREGLKGKVEQVLHFDDLLAKAWEEKQQAQEAMQQHAEVLSEKRALVLAGVEQAITQLLVQLGMPDAKLLIRMQSVEPGILGADLVKILFSANKGIPPEELKQVASGGEFSRLMLAIKYILAQKTQLPTILFDEIDTGVSGEIAIKMAKMMQEMSQHHQVISISHLPQIAARADAHFFVYKDNSAEKTSSRIRQLSEAERVEEIAQMIGGANPGKFAYDSARELMGL